MTTATDVAATVARKMVAMEKAVSSRGPLIATIKASKVMLEREARRDMGSDLALTNWRRGKPVKVRVRDRFNNDREVAVTPSPIGPMVVMTHGRVAGVSKRRKSRGRPYGPSAGKRTWTRGRDQVYRRAPVVLRRENVKSVLKAFRS